MEASKTNNQNSFKERRPIIVELRKIPTSNMPLAVNRLPNFADLIRDEMMRAGEIDNYIELHRQGDGAI